MTGLATHLTQTALPPGKGILGSVPGSLERGAVLLHLFTNKYHLKANLYLSFIYGFFGGGGGNHDAMGKGLITIQITLQSGCFVGKIG